MTIVCTPDVGVSMPVEALAPLEFSEGVIAACATIKLLQEEGLEVAPTLDDADIAARIVEEFAATEDQPKELPTTKTLSATPPAAILLTRNIIAEYSHAVVDRAVQIRHLVTNKLILESDNPDPKIRIRALELLGKISDVGLFTERSEVVVTHQSSSELEERLRSKLRLLMDVDDADVVEVGGEMINLSEELGLSADKPPLDH